MGIKQVSLSDEARGASQILQGGRGMTIALYWYEAREWQKLRAGDGVYIDNGEVGFSLGDDHYEFSENWPDHTRPLKVPPSQYQNMARLLAAIAGFRAVKVRGGHRYAKYEFRPLSKR